VEIECWVYWRGEDICCLVCSYDSTKSSIFHSVNSLERNVAISQTLDLTPGRREFDVNACF
jgi:hypothetical protein